MVYVGSKARLAKTFIPLFNNIIENKNVTTYIEPFVGEAISLKVFIVMKRLAMTNLKH